MNRELKVLHLMGSGHIGGREKFIYTVLSEINANQSLGNSTAILFQNPNGLFYQKVASLLHIEVYQLPNCKEFSLQSWLVCWKIIKTYDVVILHSPRLAFMIPLLCFRRNLLFRLSGTVISQPPISQKIRQLFRR